MRFGGHQQGATTVLGAVVLDICLCPEAAKTEWFGLENWTVQFGGCREVVPASVLVSVFISRTLFYFAVTSSGLFSVSGFASPLAKDSLLSFVFS
jgi:hypothetical protein